MRDSTRRRFLATAGLGTAAGVVAATVGSADPAGAAPAEDEIVPADAQGAMAAYIHDVRKGELALMIEGREVVITDKRLVARLATAFARAARS
jgi:DMSO/TMAO reductase YedYZ molybdopterin-dependent catalytic subunit